MLGLGQPRTRRFEIRLRLRDVGSVGDLRALRSRGSRAVCGLAAARVGDDLRILERRQELATRDALARLYEDVPDAARDLA